VRYAVSSHFFTSVPSLHLFITITDQHNTIATMNAPRFANLSIDNKPVFPHRRNWGLRETKNYGRKISNYNRQRNKKTHQGYGAPVVNKNKNSSEAWTRKTIPVPERKVPSFVLLRGNERPVSLLSIKESRVQAEVKCEHVADNRVHCDSLDEIDPNIPSFIFIVKKSRKPAVKHVHVEDQALTAEWANHNARYASFNKSMNENENKNKIPSVIFTNYITPDDAVSVLYDDIDVDDEECLPPATIAVLEHLFFDCIESDCDDYESDDDDDTDTSSDSEDYAF
jgi:hypothetical protein